MDFWNTMLDETFRLVFIGPFAASVFLKFACLNISIF